jgi:predicted Zn-dependent protease
MSRYFQWLILTALTGSPVVSILILVVAWFAVDRFTFGLFPDPVRFLTRWQRTWYLQRILGANPHDRRSRLELAELHTGHRRYQAAVDVLKPNLEAGDDDVGTLFVMGVACYGAGHVKQAEVFLDEAHARDAGFRVGAVELEQGRWRLKSGDAKGARQALEGFIRVRTGTVEGRTLLAGALLAEGKEPEAALMREEAWREYDAAPRFQRRMERFWAWRAKPSRPVLYAVMLLAGGAVFSTWVAPALLQTVRR